MGIPDVFEVTVTFVLVVLGVFVLATLIAMAWRRRSGRGWKDLLPHPFRYLAIRLGIAIALGGAFFVIVTAALVLNSHRPPGDVNPVIDVKGSSGPVTVHLDLTACDEPVDGTVSFTGGGPSTARIYSDQDGHREIRINRAGRGRFELSDPTAKRGLLSCYMELPVVRGAEGPVKIKLGVADDSEVDAAASIPVPDAYSAGDWVWPCPAGEKCPALATLGLSTEDGVKQVIVLVLAALFGSIIALFIGEAVIEPIRRRLERSGSD